MEKKTVTTVVVGTGKPTTEDVGLVKGTTLEDVKRVMKNLDKKKSYVAIRKSTGEQLNEGVDLFEVVNDHEKIEFSPLAILGGIREEFSQFFSFFIRTIDKDEPVIAHPQGAYQYSVEPETPVATPLENLDMGRQLEELGWKNNGTCYTGHISALGNLYPAELRKTWSGYKLFVYMPPPAVHRGGHRHCFISFGNGWYYVHFTNGEDKPLSMLRTAKGYMEELGGYGYV